MFLFEELTDVDVSSVVSGTVDLISTLVDRAGVSVVFVTETAFVVEETVEVCCVSCFVVVVDLEASEVIRFSRAVFDVFILGINQAEKESN